MAKWTLIICLIILQLSLDSKGVAQGKPYRLYTMQDGLSQMKITDLHLDKRAYLWIGTRNGLNKFNGENFKIYTSQDGLSHDRIHRITDNRDSNLVLLTYGGVDIFDGQQFRTYPKDFKNVLYDIAVTANNHVLICEQSTQRKLWLLRNGHYVTLCEMEDPTKYISLASSKSTGQCFFSDGNTLFQFQDDSLKKLKSFEQDIVVITGADEEPYLSNNHDNITYISRIYTDTLIIVGMINDSKNEKYDFKENYAWIQTKNGLLLPDSKSDQNKIIRDFSDVRDVVMDDHAQFWIASDNGLAKVFNNAFRSYPSDQLPNIWTVIEDDDQNIWFGSFGEGLYMKPFKQDHFKKIYDIGHCFAGSARDKNGHLYFAHEYNMAIIKDGELSSIWDKTVFSVANDIVRDQIVFGTFEGIGILRNNQIRYLGPEEGMHDNGYIQNIGLDREGNYWAGSYTGISKIDPNSGRISEYTMQNGKLPCNGIFCTHLDSEGNFWLGGDHGLLLYQENSDRILHVESQVVRSRVKSIAKFDENHLILGTKEGLYIFDRSLYLSDSIPRFYFYNDTNGYPGIDPGFTGIYRDSNGELWICSATKMVRLDPKKLKLRNQELQPVITGFNDLDLGFRHDSLFQTAFGQANVVFEFEAIGFDRQFDTKYKYKLDDEQWSDWFSGNQLVLNDLKPGKHHFSIRAGPSDLAVSLSKKDTVHFKISLPFYEYPWFPPLGVGITLLLIGMASFYFIRQRREHNQYIEQLKEARYLRSQLLLAELNPHFIFNVLASIQHKVLFEQKDRAAEYVVKLSRLMRNYLNATHKANQIHTGKPEYEIPLSKEIELLRDFMDFEKMKNDDYFEYHLQIEEGLEVEYIMIPPLLIQPFVENAIKHGLLLSEKMGNLWVKFFAERNNLICLVEDDGIGLKKAAEIKKSKIITRESLGSSIVRERIELLNKLGYQITLEIKERQDSGTLVRINLKGEL